REGPLAGPLRIVVHEAVEHLQAVMTGAQRVGIGEGETELAADGTVLDDAVQLAANVLCRHLHARQDSQHLILQRLAHESSPSMTVRISFDALIMQNNSGS